MRNFKTVIVAIVLFGFLYVSCKKDDNVNTNGYFKIDGVEYDLSSGYLQYYGETDEGCDMDLQMWSDGFDVTVDQEGELHGTGTGHGIYFELITSNSQGLDNRQYTYEEALVLPLGTFAYAVYGVNIDTSVPGSGKNAAITGGEITVHNNGDEYEITFHCVDEFGDIITGFYKGTLGYVDCTGF